MTVNPATTSLKSIDCNDCGLDYDDPGFVDLVVSHEIWAEISPTGDEGGLLCPTCMVRAAAKCGLDNIQAVFRSGPFLGCPLRPIEG